jgi:hypothetical protein
VASPASLLTAPHLACDRLLTGEAPTVRRLFLERNNIGDAGAKQLAAIIEDGALPNLTAIRLYMNAIGDNGMPRSHSCHLAAAPATTCPRTCRLRLQSAMQPPHAHD